MKKWTVISSEKVLSNPYYNVRRDHCKTALGKLIDYYIREEKGAVIIVAQRADGLIIVNELYRHGVGEVIYDFPGGMVDNGESHEDAAKREFLEETGYEIYDLIFLGQCAAAPASSELVIHIYFTDHVTNIHQAQRGLGEEMKLHFVSAEIIAEWITDKKLLSAEFVSAFYLAQKYFHKIE